MKNQNPDMWLRSNIDEFRTLTPSQQEGQLALLIVRVLEDYKREGLTISVQMHAKLASHFVVDFGFNLPIRNGQRVLEAMQQLASGLDIPPWPDGPPFALSQNNRFKQKKRDHHYVWQAYLEPWVKPPPKRRRKHEGEIWFRRRGQDAKATGTRVIAFRRDFYRLRELTQEDIRWVEERIGKGPPHLRELNRNWLSAFTDVFVARRLCEAHGVIATPDFENDFDVVLNNLEENLHETVENAGIRFLHLLRQGDLSFFETTDLAEFCLFLGVQLLRGPGMSAHLEEIIEAKRAEDPDAQLSEAVIGVMRHVIATNTGWRIYSGRDRIRVFLLKAPPSSEFITGDQPVVIARNNPMAIYYPLSPSIALLLDMGHAEPGRGEVLLNDMEVLRYNEMIMEVAFEQIYGARESALKGSFNLRTS